MKRTDERIDIQQFFSSTAYAVIGVSTEQAKVRQHRLPDDARERVHGLPRASLAGSSVEGDSCFDSVAALPAEVTSIITVVPPAQTDVVVHEALRRDIAAIWMQPGSESEAAIEAAVERGPHGDPRTVHPDVS